MVLFSCFGDVLLYVGSIDVVDLEDLALSGMKYSKNRRHWVHVSIMNDRFIVVVLKEKK